MLVLSMQAFGSGPKKVGCCLCAPQSCSKADSCEVRGGRRRKGDAAERGEDSTQQYHDLWKP